MNKILNYEEYCRIVGDLYISAKAQEKQFQELVDQLNQKIATLQKEINKWNTQNEST
jgi:hypothetical protein